MVRTQHAVAQAVESADPHAAHIDGQHGGQAREHLLGRLVGKGDGQDATRRGATSLQQPGDAGGEHARLARTGSGQNQRVACRQGDGGELLFIKSIEQRQLELSQQEAQAADAPVGAETQASPEATEPTDGVSPASEAPATAPAGEEAAVSLDSTVDAAQPRAARRFRLPQIFRPAEDDAEEIAGSIRAALSSSPQSAPENAAAEAPAQDTAPLPTPAEAAAQAPAPEAAPGADRPV